MSERDKDRDETPAGNGFEPGDEDFEEEPEEGFEGEGGTDESAEAEYREEAEAPSRRRFGWSRGTEEPEEGAARRPVGSVRESHERVHIDDRLSIVYALLASGVLIGLLVLAMAAQFVPQPVAPSFPPLVVPTFQATPSPSAGPSASVSLAPSTSPAPTTPAPSTSPVASPS
jgi:hypothetical protein